MKQQSTFWLLLSVLLLASCQSVKQPAEISNDKPAFNTNECFVRARILEIIPDSTATEGPCLDNPCLAKVKVIKVIQCGKISTKKPKAGQEKVVRFRYTLSDKANEIFPDVNHNFSGLEPLELFDAIWEFPSKKGSRKNLPEVQEYKKL